MTQISGALANDFLLAETRSTQIGSVTDNLETGIVQRSPASALNYALAPRLIACVAGLWIAENKYCLPVDTAGKVIQASGSRVLVLHLCNPRHLTVPCDKALDFDDLLESLKTPIKDFVLFFNTSLCENLEDVTRIIGMMDVIQSTPSFNGIAAFIKLEILDENLRPDDRKSVSILSQLSARARSLCIPYLTGNPLFLQHVIDLGCPAVRIWCSDIGKGQGITDIDRLRQALRLAEIPMILEGGLETTHDVQQALGMGFSAVLMNSAFRHSPDPIKLASEVRVTIDNLTEHVPANSLS